MTESETEPESVTENETGPESESETEPESVTESETEPETKSETDSETEINLAGLPKSGDIELETGMMVLHEDLQQVHEDLQAVCCFIIVFLIIVLCQYIYKFFKMFFRS